MQGMKRFWLVILLGGLISGCAREEVPLALAGDWRWEQSSGGIAPLLVKPAPGERVVLRFTSDRQFSLYQNDTLTFSGSFRLTKGRSIYSGKDESMIEAAQVKAANQVRNPRRVVYAGIIMALSEGQLSIGDNAYDGFASEFVRN